MVQQFFQHFFTFYDNKQSASDEHLHFVRYVGALSTPLYLVVHNCLKNTETKMQFEKILCLIYIIFKIKVKMCCG